MVLHFLIKIVLIQGMQRWGIRGKRDSMFKKLCLTTDQGLTVSESINANQN